MKWSLENIEVSYSGNKVLSDGTESTEVIITTHEGDTYSAPFFSYGHVLEMIDLIQKGQIPDEDHVHLKGRYLWRKNMILIDQCSETNIREAIADLIEEGNILEVFRKL